MSICPHCGETPHLLADCPTSLSRADAMAALLTARRLLRRALPIVQADAQMIADISRHAPLSPAEQARHDTTEYESERLAREIPQALRPSAQLLRPAPP